MVTTLLTALIGYVKDFTFKAYEILVDASNQLYQFVQLIVGNFPFDNPRKTLLLSMIFLFSTISIMVVLSSDNWMSEGLNPTGTIQINRQLEGVGDSSVEGGGDRMPEPEQPPSGTSLTNCYSDDDCIQYESGTFGNILCCLPEMFEGYSCSGHCLRDEAYGRDACKHPNACFYSGRWDDHVGDSPLRCDNHIDPTLKCQRDASDTTDKDTNGKCCISGVDACLGFCMKPGSSYDCSDYLGCYEQASITVVIEEGGPQ